MTARELARVLALEGVTLSLDGDSLVFEGSHRPVSSERIAQIRAHKAGLMAMLLAAPKVAIANPAAIELKTALQDLNAKWAKGQAWVANDPARTQQAARRFGELAGECTTLYTALEAIAPELLDGFELFPATPADEAATVRPAGLDVADHFARLGGWVAALERVGQHQADAQHDAVIAWAVARSPDEKAATAATYRQLMGASEKMPWAC